MKRFAFAAAVIVTAFSANLASAQANIGPVTSSAVVVDWKKCEVGCRRGSMVNACPTDDNLSFFSDKQVRGFHSQQEMFAAARAGCNKQVAHLSPDVLLPKAKPAPNLKPGQYAQNSAIYAEFLRNCQRPYEQHYSSDNVRAQKLEDESARRMEELYRTNRVQYDLQLKGCEMSLPVKRRSLVEQRQASNVSPVVAAGAGVAVGMIAAHALQHRGHRRGRLSIEDEGRLQELLARKDEQVLGGQPANSQGYLGDRPRFLPVRRGCTERRIHNPEAHRTFVRVICN